MEICFAEITRRIQKNFTHPNHHLALFSGAFSSRAKLALNSLPPFGACATITCVGLASYNRCDLLYGLKPTTDLDEP